MSLAITVRPCCSLQRRNFVKVAASTPLVLSVVPSHVLGAPASKAPSEKLNLACVGMGFQGQRMLHSLLKRSDVRVVAVGNNSLDTQPPF